MNLVCARRVSEKTALLLRSGTEVWWARAVPAHWYDWRSLHRVASCECTKTATRGERRENTGPGVTKSASSHHDDPRTSRSFTRSPTAELQQTRSVPALWPRTLELSSAFWRANLRLQHRGNLPSCTAAPRRVRASGGFVNYLRPLRVFCRLSEAQTAADSIQSTTIAPWTGSPQAHLCVTESERVTN